MAEKTDQRLLEMWRQALLNTVRANEPDLTMRQVAVLTTVYMTDPPHTVRGLASDLNVAKPVITRALDTLGRMGLLKRKRDDADKRNVLIQRTVKGAVYLSELSDRIVRADKASRGEQIDDLDEQTLNGAAETSQNGNQADQSVEASM